MTHLLPDEAAGVGLHAVGQVRVREEDIRVDVVPDHVLLCMRGVYERLVRLYFFPLGPHVLLDELCG